MRIPTFWARAKAGGFEAPGWSFTSIDEARRVAAERAKVLAAVLQGQREPQGRYLYGDRPVKEPILETIGSGARPQALLTRNSYGAVCLNTEDVAFVDVDGGEAKNVRAVQARNPSWGLRVYQTKAGLRVVATHARISPMAPEAQALFKALGADPLYIKLCAAQESFRARLTPKPWRMGMSRLPASFPWRDASVEEGVNEWVAAYDEAREQYAVCELVDTLGPKSGDAVIDGIVQLHDSWVLRPGKPLA